MTLAAIFIITFLVAKYRHHEENRRETIREYNEQQARIRKAGGRFGHQDFHVRTIRNS